MNVATRKKTTKSTKGSRPKPAAKATKIAARARKPARKPAARPAARPAGDPMRTLAQRIIDVTLANDDEAAFALYAPDVESIEAGQPPTHGIDAIRGKFAGWRNMVSNASFEPRRVCVDGNTIVIEWMGHVTLAASGRPAQLHEVAIHEIRDGKIAREAFFYNPAALAP
jgi:ketosteroid isomerase-like protein